MKIIEEILNIIFPPRCLNCGELGDYVCEKCLYELRFYTTALQIDVKNPALNKLFACCTYADGARGLVKALKYRSASHVTKTIAQLMIEHIPLPDDIDFFTFIPLHRQRERDRGFNQAELLAKQLGKWLHTPIQNAIIRTRKTSPQAELSREERLTHLRGAFTVADKNLAKGKVIAVVDDVATTGTTLNEVAKLLKKHGAKKVYGVVFAHGR